MRTLTVIDDLVADPTEIREMGLSGGFADVEHGGKVFPGVGYNERTERDIRVALLPEMSEAMCGQIIPHLSFFRIGMRGQKAPTFIHADLSVPGEWACVYYLTPDNYCDGGTAFWRHAESGLLKAPPKLSDIEATVLNEDGLDESNWIMEDMVSMRMNRMIIYPGRIFHSVYPRVFPADTIEEGRLVWVCFFDIA